MSHSTLTVTYSVSILRTTAPPHDSALHSHRASSSGKGDCRQRDMQPGQAGRCADCSKNHFHGVRIRCVSKGRVRHHDNASGGADDGRAVQQGFKTRIQSTASPNSGVLPPFPCAVCTCICACVHVYRYACMHVCIYAHMHVFLHACLHECMCACLCACMRVCVYVYMCA